ncbi:MAG: DUF2167 domain-containing protein [Pseudomonadota bacterium]
MRHPVLTFVCCTLLLPAGLQAQDEPAEPAAAEATGDEGGEPMAPPFKILPGPVDGALGEFATIQVPEGYGFVPKSEMPALNAATQNLDNPSDLGAILGDKFIVFFSWDDIGYVKDDEKDELDAKELLENFQQGQLEANKVREQQGFPPLFIDGWQTPPYYDQQTNNLTWATKLRSGDAEGFTVNHNVRLLGRRGVMSATLVGAPEGMADAIVALNGMLGHYTYNEGQRYSEFSQGDKLAAVGLSALVLGGGAALAAKTGLLGQLGKFIKVIVLGVVGAAAAVGKWFKSKFGRSQS